MSWIRFIFGHREEIEYDVSSVSSSLERIKELWVPLGLSRERWSSTVSRNISLRWPIYLINSVDKSKVSFSSKAYQRHFEHKSQRHYHSYRYYNSFDSIQQKSKQFISEQCVKYDLTGICSLLCFALNFLLKKEAVFFYVCH